MGSIAYQDSGYCRRDPNVMPSLAPPIPRYAPEHVSEEDRYEVVIVGAGPAGMLLKLLLSRFGLGDKSVLCIESRDTILRAGQADGIQPRTMEVLKSLGLMHEISTDGGQVWEVAFWNPVQPQGENGEQDAAPRGIERTAIVDDVALATRYPHEATTHQGKVERILEDDLLRYGKEGIQRSTTLLHVRIDEKEVPAFPVVAEIESPIMGRRTIRSKYLVGADGAHSTVRRCMGLKLEGETTDHIWGVIDLVVDTDFPDVRRRTAVHSDAGSIMIIPRERSVTGDLITRLYVQIPGDVKVDEADIAGTTKPEGFKQGHDDPRARRGQVTMESIMEQAQEAVKPYYIKHREGTNVEWWTAYQIGQRVSDRFLVTDSNGMQRVFIVGDACHTHSPKAGQGMNVSMMDSFNLAWKLAYSINGLTPASHDSAGFQDKILGTYEIERRTIAQQLVEFDKSFSSMFSGKIGTADVAGSGLTHDQFLEVFRTGNGFTSGCGIEYPESILVDKSIEHNVVKGTDYLAGILRPGRRLLNVKLKRHADGCHVDLHDEIPTTGAFRILCLTSKDLLDPHGTSSQTLSGLCDMVKCVSSLYSSSNILQLITIYPRALVGLTPTSPPKAPLPTSSFVWSEVPSSLREVAEMSVYCSAVANEDAYGLYGVSEDEGVVAVIRPDGYVGVVACLGEAGVDKVRRFLQGAIWWGHENK
ncbi:phenol 2-monooxygenase [Nannizzia gypsea CBS 118893]|uniref:Phenol 2-monooxygenase n=1 Tax=Arthroderma gypseum (strain ATCC MYA-4604 / CBS 118893) TaxID=535722 RepID=E5R3P0_ARTGP|nr:phenol 2-monooxygenase [Nannizzia gypsea CBS 118893]EFQ97164.1 phenol 2-monooxygenase [Nannizzia gypsea CBS 118893]